MFILSLSLPLSHVAFGPEGLVARQHRFHSANHSSGGNILAMTMISICEIIYADMSKSHSYNTYDHIRPEMHLCR